MNEVIYLLVPAEESEEAQRRGAHWDPVHLRWYIEADQDPEPFLEWLPVEELEEDEVPELCAAAPVFVVEAAAICPSCGSNSPVITLAAEHFAGLEPDAPDFLLGKATQAQDELDDDDDLAEETFSDDLFEGDEEDLAAREEYVEEAGLMRFQFIKELPAEVVSLLGRRYPFFRKRPAPIGPGAYFVNLCSACGEPFEDLYLHSEPGIGFVLAQQDAEKVVLRELPVEDNLLIAANFGRVVPDLILQHARRQPFPADS